MRPDTGVGSAPLRERKKDATRRALRSAALRLFGERGYGATSVDEIAAAANVSRSTYFRYFGSKEAVLFDQMDQNGTRFVAALAARPGTEDPVTAFQEALIQVSEGTDQGPERQNARIFEDLMSRDPELHARRMAELARWTDAIAQTLAERVGAPEARPEDRLAAAVCITTTQHMGRMWRATDEDLPLAETIRGAFGQLRSLAR